MFEIIKTFDDACNALEIMPSIPDLSAIPDKYKGPAMAHYKLMIIIEALNDGWFADWNDFKQGKFILSFEMNEEFRSIFIEFNESCGDNWDEYPGSPVSTLFVFKSEEIMNYASEQFRDLFKQYFLPVIPQPFKQL